MSCYDTSVDLEMNDGSTSSLSAAVNPYATTVVGMPAVTALPPLQPDRHRQIVGALTRKRIRVTCSGASLMHPINEIHELLHGGFADQLHCLDQAA